MRVIRTEDSDQSEWSPRLCTHRGQPYAILSHRWSDNPNHEILFSDISEIDFSHDPASDNPQAGRVKNPLYRDCVPNVKPAFPKLRGAARQALHDGYKFVWIDTCCIDKSSSAELSEAINSMFQWYKGAAMCYTYLPDVEHLSEGSKPQEFARSEWWKRGWTLQELLAPRQLTFFTIDWEAIGERDKMGEWISEITGIDENVLNGTIPLSTVSIAQRMSWASRRATTRIEDMAYCLLGIFGISMPPLYGEGEAAFLRLQEEIIKRSDDESIFAWTDKSVNHTQFHGLLASQPSAFVSSGQIVRYYEIQDQPPYAMTNRGLSISLKVAKMVKKFKPGSSAPTLFEREMAVMLEHGTVMAARLNCIDLHDGEQVRLYLDQMPGRQNQYARVGCDRQAKPEKMRVFEDNFANKAMYVAQNIEQEQLYSNTLGDNPKIMLVQLIRHASPEIRLRLLEGDVHRAKFAMVVQDRTGKTSQVRVNNKLVTVGYEIVDFLRRQSEDDRTELFWINDICLHDILHHWGTDRAIQLISQIARNCTILHALVGSYDVAKLASLRGGALLRTSTMFSSWNAYNELQKLADHPFWRDPWHVQEIFLAPGVKIWLGSSTISFEDLDSICQISLRDNPSISVELEPLTAMVHFMKLKESHAGPVEISDKGKHIMQRPTGIKLETLLALFKHQRTKAPTNRVYALLEPSGLAAQVAINYLVPRRQLFVIVLGCVPEQLTLSLMRLLIEALELPHLRGYSSDMSDNRYVLACPVKVFEAMENQNEEKACDLWLLASSNEHPDVGLILQEGVEDISQASTSSLYCKPYMLFKAEGTGWQDDTLELPRDIDDALRDTTFELRNVQPQPTIHISANGKGLLALGLCITNIAEHYQIRSNRGR